MRKCRFLCVALVFALLIGLLPTTAMAADTHPNTYINTGNNRIDILGVARTQVGYRETGNNNTKYGQWYGLNYNPWCAMFISWCARSAGVPGYVLKNTALAYPSYEGFNVVHISGKDYTPLPGDLFFRYDQSQNEYTHVGLVYHVDGEYFYSIEGNSHNGDSENGNRVLCLKHKIEDYSFGLPYYPQAEALPAPVLHTEYTQYECGRDAIVTWNPVENAVSYHVTVYFNGDIIRSVNLGTETSYAIQNVDVGDYLISVSAKYADGREGFSQTGFDGIPAPKLTVTYNANGGKITPEYKYMVTRYDGINFRASYSTSSAKVGWLPTGTQLDIYQMVYYGGYTWGYTCYNGTYGWCALDYCQRVGFGLDSNAQIFQYPSYSTPNTWWYSGLNDSKTLLDPQSVGLSREYYDFMGWSTAADGSAAAFGKNGSAVTANEIAPNFDRQDMNVTLYALWQKIVESITIETLPVKTEYYAEETLDTTGMQLRVAYADGTEEVLGEGFTVTGFDSTVTGEQILTVAYGNKETNFKVTIDARISYTADDDGAVITAYHQGDGGVAIVPATIGGQPVTGIADNAFADCDKITAIVIPATVNRIGDNAFSGCSALTNVNYSGTQAQWDAIVIGSGNDALTGAVLTCDYIVLGDYTGDMKVDNNDVLYLLKYSLFPDLFPVTSPTDLNADGVVDNGDVLLLLKHSLFPDMFPLKPQSNEGAVDEPTDEPVDEPTDEPADDPTDEPADDPTDESADDPTDEPADDPTDEPADDPTDEPVNEPTDDSAGEPTGDTTKVTSGDITDLNIGDAVEPGDGNPTE